MDPLSIAMGLAQFAPTIVKWITGSDSDASNAQKAVDIAKTVTGKSTGDDALAAIKADPAMALQFQQAVMAHALAMEQEYSKQLETINATMRAEAQSGSWWQSGWRPFWGFATGLAFAAQMGGVTFLLFFHPDLVGAAASSLSSLTALWGIALSVLGVAVWKRTTEKQISANIAAGLPAGATPVAGLPWLNKAPAS